MTKPWPSLRLGQVLTPAERGESVDATKEYRLLGIRLEGQGPFLRETVMGAQTSATKLFRVAAGDFIYSRLFACRGAFGVISKELDGCYVSGEFPTFLPVPGKVDVEFLKYWFRLPTVIAAVDEDCSGSTPLTRNRFKENFFVALEIPLPSLSEQRRVVARIEELAAQIHQARALRHQAAEQAEQLMAGEERRIWPDSSLKGAPHLKNLTSFLARGKQSEQGESEHFLIKTQHVQQDRYIPTMMRLASHVAAKVKPEAVVLDEDILIACSAAGCLGRVARYRFDGRTASTDTHVAVLRPNPKAVDPNYLYAYLRGAQGQHQLRSRERGDWQREKIGFRLTELNLNDLRQVPVPLPPLPEQRRIVSELDALQAEVDALKRLQAETAAELDALLPAILDRAFKGEF
jgi:type I restriction enzyme S subunit